MVNYVVRDRDLPQGRLEVGQENCLHDSREVWGRLLDEDNNGTAADALNLNC